jgi:hypothetical protein
MTPIPSENYCLNDLEVRELGPFLPPDGILARDITKLEKKP